MHPHPGRGYPQAARRWAGLVLAGVLAGWSGVAPAATEAGGEITIVDPLEDDFYAAGRSVDLLAAVDGDAVLAAGTVTLQGDVTGDFIAAGGNVEVLGGVGDDLRVAGGRVLVGGFVTDGAVIAGGSVRLLPDSAIAGRTCISGREVSIDGQLGSELRVMAGSVRIAGQIAGDVEISASEIEIAPGAVIGGNLLLRGDPDPVIASDVEIYGEVLVPDEEHAEAPAGDGVAVAGTVMGTLAVFLTGAGLWWLLPALVVRGGEVLRTRGARTLLYGLLLLVLAPVVIVLLFVTIVGWLLALVLLAGWLLGLAAAVALGIASMAAALTSRDGAVRRPGGSGLLILLLLAAALLLLQAVPVVGGLALFLMMLLGLGVLGVTGRERLAGL